MIVVRFIVAFAAHYTNGDIVVINVTLVIVEEEVIKAYF